MNKSVHLSWDVLYMIGDGLDNFMFEKCSYSKLFPSLTTFFGWKLDSFISKFNHSVQI